MIIAALFTIAPNWKQSKYSSAANLINKLWSIHIMEKAANY